MIACSGWDIASLLLSVLRRETIRNVTSMCHELSESVWRVIFNGYVDVMSEKSEFKLGLILVVEFIKIGNEINSKREARTENAGRCGWEQ